MASYEIEQSETGVVLGVYEGETAADAIRAMLADAGCTDEPDAGLVVREVDDTTHAELDEDEDFNWECAASRWVSDGVDE